MSLAVQKAVVGARGIDTVTTLTSESAAALKAYGFSFAIRYLGSIGAFEVAAITGAGLLLSFVTYADKWDGAATVAELEALGIPAGATIWLDVESVNEPATMVIGKINAWANAVSSAGYQPGLYVGAAQPLTAAELYALGVVRYWHSMSSVPTPSCGFCQLQLYPTVQVAGVSVDIDVIQQDYEGRLPMLVGT
jgi:hypothetical protein